MPTPDPCPDQTRGRCALAFGGQTDWPEGDLLIVGYDFRRQLLGDGGGSPPFGVTPKHFYTIISLSCSPKFPFRFTLQGPCLLPTSHCVNFAAGSQGSGGASHPHCPGDSVSQRGLEMRLPKPLSFNPQATPPCSKISSPLGAQSRGKGSGCKVC